MIRESCSSWLFSLTATLQEPFNGSSEVITLFPLRESRASYVGGIKLSLIVQHHKTCSRTYSVFCNTI